MRKSLAERFWSKVNHLEDGCWPWTASLNNAGYGKIVNGEGVLLLAHRVAWEQVYGPIPTGLLVLHRCDNRMCVNPVHLFLGTQADNIRDAFDKRRLAHGERHRGSKLVSEQVIEMRALYAGGEGPAALGRRFGVSESLARKIVHHKMWRHIP